MAQNEKKGGMIPSQGGQVSGALLTLVHWAAGSQLTLGWRKKTCRLRRTAEGNEVVGFFTASIFLP